MFTDPAHQGRPADANDEEAYIAARVAVCSVFANRTSTWRARVVLYC